MNPEFSNFTWLNTAFEQVEMSHRQDKLAHGMMFVAPDGSGKMQFATRLAASLLCVQSQDKLQIACEQCKHCELIKSQTHPDLTLLDRLTDSKGKQKTSIGIDQVRDLSDKLLETAQMGGWRIAIIASVERLTRGAFNALLKTLEEPGKNTLLIMLADNMHRVPATIKSRCQIVHFDLNPDKLIEWLVQATQVDTIAAAEALEATQYSPFKALDYLKSDLSKQILTLQTDLDDMLTNKLSAHELITKHSPSITDLWAQIANYFQKVQLSILDSNQTNYANVPAQLPAKIYQQLLDFNRAQCAGSNLQTNLQLETILIPWFELGRKIVHYSNR